LKYSKGVEHVLVNGVFVVKNGKNVKDIYPGRPILGRYRK
jgi:hypothetical protein